jgi:hypothetical protein
MNSITNLKEMNRIIEIWNKLEANPTSLSGVEKIRYSSESFCDLFLGIKTPENQRLLALKVSTKIGKDSIQIRNIRGLRVDMVADPQQEGSVLLVLVLTELRFKDIFDVLISDLISHLIALSNEAEIARRFSERLYKWQALFEKYNPEGLSYESQQGLYAELVALKKLLQHKDTTALAIQSWVGSKLAIQDFQMGLWAMEVKSTSGNNHQRMHISNERQLDDSGLAWLFLYHLSLDIRPGNPATLPAIIGDIKNMLNSDAQGYDAFCDKLAEYGYFDSHKDLYAETGYNVRSEHFYHVHDNFPRIIEDGLRAGVGDVKYSIDVSGCEQFLVAEDFVIQKFASNG